jgi:hypothetical protein
MIKNMQGVKGSPTWLDIAEKEAWKEASRIIKDTALTNEMSVYQNDPVKFGREVLGETYTEDIEKVMYSVLENPVTIARSATAPGKSHGAARIAAWFYKTHENSKVFTTAAPPLENLKRILWGEIMGIVRKHPRLFDTDTIRSLFIARNSESFIAGLTIPTSGTSEEREAKFSGKHAPYLLFIVDEGDAVPEEVYRGIEGCMSGGMARLLVMFNPKIMAGSLYRKEISGMANVVKLSAFNHPNVVQGKIVIPGAVDRNITLQRINEWTVPLKSTEKRDASCYDVPDFLVGATAVAPNGVLYEPLEAGVRKIVNPAFSYMVLGEYPAQNEMQLINQVWIDAARSRYDMYVAQRGAKPPEYVKAIMGLDPAELGTDANACCIRYGGFVLPMLTWNGVDTDMSATKALEIYRQYDCDIAYIDATGIGSSIAPSMSRRGRDDSNRVRAVGVKLASSPGNFIKSDLGEFYQLRDQLWWALREWLRIDTSSMLPPDPYLLDDLRAPTYRIDDRGKIRISRKDDLRKILRRSPDRGDALTLTFSPQARPKIIRLNIAG